MKWKCKRNRVIKRYSWYPRYDPKTEQWHWLETVYIQQWRFDVDCFWETVKFLSKEEYLKLKKELQK